MKYVIYRSPGFGEPYTVDTSLPKATLDTVKNFIVKTAKNNNESTYNYLIQEIYDNNSYNLIRF